jgi:hypothetical protein
MSELKELESAFIAADVIANDLNVSEPERQAAQADAKFFATELTKRQAAPSIPTHTPNALDAEVAGFKDTNLANQEKADQEQARIDKLPPSTPRQTFLSSPLNKTLKGWSDPVTGSAQLAPRILEKLTSAGGFFPNPISNLLRDESKKIDAGINADADEYNRAREVNRQEGFDGWRATGNMTSPATLATGYLLPIKGASKALKMFGAGTLGGLMQPVENMTEDQSYTSTKTAQGLLGGTGGVLLGKLFSAASNRVAAYIGNRNVDKSIDVAAKETDEVIKKALKETNQTKKDIPDEQYNELKNRVFDALKNNEKLDAAATLRKQDFDAEGIDPLKGWITRDSAQYADEFNLRGLDYVGKPLLNRFDAANDKLQAKFADLAEGAESRFAAGGGFTKEFKGFDETLRQEVTALYKEARASAGKDQEIPLTELAQRYAEIIDDYGDNVPSVIQKKFAKLGIDPNSASNQKTLFNLEDANKLLTVINKNDPGFSDRPIMGALSEIRDAVKESVYRVADDGGPFAAASNAARKRFQLHDKVPALSASSKPSTQSGSIEPEDFVNKFLIRGKVRDVRAMGEIMSPEAKAQARAQIGKHLQKAAFGQNKAGDAAVSPTRLSKVLDDLQDEKLAVFLTQEEIYGLKRAARIAAFVNTKPRMSPTNPAGSAAAYLNAANATTDKVRKISVAANVINSLVSPVKNAGNVNKALKAEIPVERKIPTAVKGLLDKMDTAVSTGGGLLSATPLR